MTISDTFQSFGEHLYRKDSYFSADFDFYLLYMLDVGYSSFEVTAQDLSVVFNLFSSIFAIYSFFLSIVNVLIVSCFQSIREFFLKKIQNSGPFLPE